MAKHEITTEEGEFALGDDVVNGNDDNTVANLQHFDDPAAASLEHALSGSLMLVKIAMAVLVVLFVINRFTYVDQGEALVIRRFGKYLTDETGKIKAIEAGEYRFIWPAPIEKAIVIDIAQEEELDIGQDYLPRHDESIIAMPDAEQEAGQLPIVNDLDPQLDGYNLTGDLNIVHTEWKVKYRVADLNNYLLASSDPVKSLQAVAKGAIVRRLAGTSADELFYGNPAELIGKIEEDIKHDIGSQRGDYKYGIELISVVNNKSGRRQPGKAYQAFAKFFHARTESRGKLDKARAEAAKIIDEAQAEALAIKKEAEKYALEVPAKAESDAKRLAYLLDRFENNSEDLNQFLKEYRADILSESLTNARKYFLRSGDGKNTFWLSPGVDEYFDAEAAKKESDRFNQ